MQITYEEWQSKYKPVENKINPVESFDGTAFETYGTDLDYIVSLTNSNKSIHYVWTLIESDNENEYIVPGYCLVNRQLYFITENPWEVQDMYNLEVNINQMVTIEQCVEFATKFIETTKYKIMFDVKDFVASLPLAKGEMTIGDAKYLLMEYIENTYGMELSYEEQDKMHDFYSQIL